VDMPPQTDVVQDAHAFEKLDLLERPGDSQLGPLIRLQAGNFLPIEDDLSLLGMIKAINTIQADGLPRPVGPDERKDLARSDLQAHPPKGFHSAEGDVNVLDLQLDFTGIGHSSKTREVSLPRKRKMNRVEEWRFLDKHLLRPGIRASYIFRWCISEIGYERKVRIYLLLTTKEVK